MDRTRLVSLLRWRWWICPTRVLHQVSLPATPRATADTLPGLREYPCPYPGVFLARDLLGNGGGRGVCERTHDRGVSQGCRERTARTGCSLRVPSPNRANGYHGDSPGEGALCRRCSQGRWRLPMAHIGDCRRDSPAGHAQQKEHRRRLRGGVLFPRSPSRSSAKELGNRDFT